MSEKRKGGWDCTMFYRCTICKTKVPKTEDSFCPDCRQKMRAIPHNPKHKRRLELMGLIKRY